MKLKLPILFTLTILLICSFQLAARSQPQPYNLAATAKQLYQTGEFAQAAQVWQQTAAAFANIQDVLNQGRALSNLSLTYQELGQWENAQTAITESLALLPGENSQGEAGKILAQALNIQGKLQLATGQPELAIDTWKQAEELSEKIGDRLGVAQSKINQAEALQKLGLLPRACQTLLTALSLDIPDCPQLYQLTNPELIKSLQNATIGDRTLKIIGLNSLGNLLTVVGNTHQSEIVLKESLKLAQDLSDRLKIAATYLNLGNNARLAENHHAALTYYQQAEQSSPNTLLTLQSQLNQLSLIASNTPLEEITELWPKIQLNLEKLPPSQPAVSARVNFADSLICLRTILSADRPEIYSPILYSPILYSPILQKCLSQAANKPIISPNIQLNQLPDWAEIAEILQQGYSQAESLADVRSQSLVLGYLAAVDRQRGDYLSAQQLTEQALMLAQSIDGSDIAYLWQWQLGRLRIIQGDKIGAIGAYGLAFETLQSLRSELVAMNQDVQFNFRDRVAPVYREYVNLLLSSQSPSQANLKQARQAIEALQLAELHDFFREACLEAKPEQIDRLIDKQNTDSAVFYGIILEDRLEVILKLPGQAELYHYKTAISQAAIESTLTELIDRLNDRTRLPVEIQELSQPVYDWLIRPAEEKLAQQPVNTLVFVLDGLLRNIPMSVLHDRQQYLIEKYAIALSPGLQLLDPRPLTEIQLNALTAGLSESRTLANNQQFSPLPNVPQELTQIQALIKNSNKLLNQEFITQRLESELNQSNYSVVHLATHGQFSSNFQDTFILTWDNPININQLKTLLKSNRQNQSIPLELLVLSACETASGDDRATLGLAGVAVQAGARSTLATLWSVNDESTAEFMQQFYQELVQVTAQDAQENITKAQALQKAQLALLNHQGDRKKWQRPYYWAPFVLVGNWL